MCPSASALVLGRVSQGEGLCTVARSLRSVFPSHAPKPGVCRLGGLELGAWGPAAPSAAPEQESGVGVVAAPPSLSPWGGAGVPPRLGEDRPAFRPLWGRGCPFFALQGPAQAEREAPGPTVWRMPQTSPFSGGPPFPPPGDASPAAAAPAPSALCGRGGASWGLPSAPGSLGRLWG